MDMGGSGLGDLASGGGDFGGGVPGGGDSGGFPGGGGGSDPFASDPQLTGMDSGGGFGDGGGFPGGGGSMPGGGGSSPATDVGTQNDPAAIAPTAMSTASSQPATQVGSSAPGAGTQAKGGGGGGLPSEIQKLLQGGQKGGGSQGGGQKQGGQQGGQVDDMQQVADTLLGKHQPDGGLTQLAQADTGSMTDAADPGTVMMPPGSDRSGPNVRSPVPYESSGLAVPNRQDPAYGGPPVNKQDPAFAGPPGTEAPAPAPAPAPETPAPEPAVTKPEEPAEPTTAAPDTTDPKTAAPGSTSGDPRANQATRQQPMNIFKVLADLITKGPISLFQNLPQLMQQLAGQSGFPNPLGHQAQVGPRAPAPAPASVPPQSGPASGQNKDPNEPGISDAEKQDRIRKRDLPPGGTYVPGKDGKPVLTQTNPDGSPKFDASGNPVPVQAPQGGPQPLPPGYSRPPAPLTMGRGPGQVLYAKNGHATGRPSQPNVDRSQFRSQMNDNNIYKLAWMINGEVGRGAPLQAKIVQAETAFNRAQERKDTLDSSLRARGERAGGGRAGPYYEQVTSRTRGTYRQDTRPNAQDLQLVRNQIVPMILGGSNLSDVGFGPMNGNGSGGLAMKAFRNGVPGYKMNGGDTYFREWSRPLPTMRSTGTPEAMAAPNTQLAMRGDTANDASFGATPEGSYGMMGSGMEGVRRRVDELDQPNNPNFDPNRAGRPIRPDERGRGGGRLTMGKGDLGATTRTPDDLRTIISEPRAATPPGQPAGPTMEGVGFPPSRKPYSPPNALHDPPANRGGEGRTPKFEPPKEAPPSKGAKAATPRGDAGPTMAGVKAPPKEAKDPETDKEPKKKTKPKGMKPSMKKHIQARQRRLVEIPGTPTGMGRGTTSYYVDQ